MRRLKDYSNIASSRHLKSEGSSWVYVLEVCQIIYLRSPQKCFPKKKKGGKQVGFLYLSADGNDAFTFPSRISQLLSSEVTVMLLQYMVSQCTLKRQAYDT